MTATEPVVISKRAIDVTPYQHGIWCSVGGSAPFVNEIVSRQWSEDGTTIVFMLDSFNFVFHRADGEMDVVEIGRPAYVSDETVSRRLAEDAEKMRRRPDPEKVRRIKELETEIARLKEGVA